MLPSDFNESTKYRQVRDAISDSIRKGHISPDERLPGERILARTHNVSYMTARRAVQEMVELGLLERRGREGTFVRVHATSRLTTTIHLIYPDVEAPAVKTFLRLSLAECEKRGWQTNVIRLNSNTRNLALRVLSERELVLIFVEPWELQGEIGQAIQRAQGRAVLLGNRLDGVGIPSVLADDAQSIRLAMQRLRVAGHEKIAFVSTNFHSSVPRVQIATWRSCLKNIEREVGHPIPQDLIVITMPRYECLTQFTLDGIKAYFEGGGEATALITCNDEMALTVLSACRAAGKVVPQQISLINSGDSPLLPIAFPAITCVDTDLAAHIQQAMEFLEAAEKGHVDTVDCLRLIEPHLIERDSVAAAP